MEMLEAVTRGLACGLIYRSCHSLNSGPQPRLLLNLDPVSSSFSGGREDGWTAYWLASFLCGSTRTISSSMMGTTSTGGQLV